MKKKHKKKKGWHHSPSTNQPTKSQPNSLPKRPVKQLTKESSKRPTKLTAKRPIMQPTKQPSKRSTKQFTKRPTKRSTNRLTKGLTKRPTKRSTKGLPKRSIQQLPRPIRWLCTGPIAVLTCILSRHVLLSFTMPHTSKHFHRAVQKMWPYSSTEI